MSAAGAGAGRRITVRSVSCRGVKSFVPFQKPPLYVAVSLGSRREKTPADPDGGENPDWEGAVFAFDLDYAGAGDGLLQFEVKAQVPLLGNKLVGTACVPVADLGPGDAAALRHVSYQVSSPDGKPNGTLSFAYAITGGGASYQQPQLCLAPNGVRPQQDPSFCCAPPPPPSSAAYPAPAMPNFAPHGSSYPPTPSPSPPVSAPLYPPLQDLLPPSSYPPPPPPPPLPPPPMMDPQYPAPNFPPNSSYPPPPALATAYPPPPASCTDCSAPLAQYISSYPPPAMSNYPPPPPSVYPPPPPTMNPEFPASNFPPPTSSYPPPPPPPESGSEYPVLPRSTPSPVPSAVDRTLPYMAPPSAPPLRDAAIAYPTLAARPPPSGGSYYPPPGPRHPEEAATTPYYYPPPGTRYS